MASQQFIQRGGTEPEYQIYQALFRTGRKEERDFIFNPVMQQSDVSFFVFAPPTGIRVGDVDEATRLRDMGVRAGLRISVIDSERALSSPDSALENALGGI